MSWMMPGEAQALDLLPGQVHLLGDGHGQAGDPVLVPGHVGVPHLEGHGHGPERPLQGFLQAVERALEVVLGAAGLEDLAVELVVGPGQLLGPLIDEMVDLDPGQPQLLLDADALGGVLVQLGGPLGGLLLEEAVAALEVAEGLLQPVEHAVEGPGQQAGLVPAVDAGPLLEVAAGQPLGGPGQLDERTGDHAAEKDDAEDAEDEKGQAHDGRRRRGWRGGHGTGRCSRP